MPGRVPCPPGCDCKKHSRGQRLNWSDPEARKAYGREDARRRRAADGGQAAREAARRWQEKNPGYRLAYKFGLTVEQWDEMFAAQGGLCYLCDEPLRANWPGSRGSNIHVDHDRSCCRGEKSCGTCIRGLACFACNVGIAKFGESPDRMRRVADNLEMANRRLRNPAPRGSMAGSNAPAGR